MNNSNNSIDSNVIDFNGEINTNLIISLLKEYVNPNTPWTHDPQGNPLSPEQLIAIWEKEKKEIIKQMHIKDSQEKYVSEMKYSEINNELVKRSFKTTDSFEAALLVCAEKEDWDGLLEILGDEKEDIIFIDEMRKNPESFKEIIAEFFDEEMIEKIAAFECGYCKIGQRAIPIYEVKREIQGG